MLPRLREGEGSAHWIEDGAAKALCGSAVSARHPACVHVPLCVNCAVKHTEKYPPLRCHQARPQ